LNNKIEPLVLKETAKFTVNTEELEMYKLTNKILDRLEDVIKPEDPHKMPKIKRIINWLIRGDFYGEWNAPTDIIGGLGKFIPFIQKVFCSVIKGANNYDITVSFMDAAHVGSSGTTGSKPGYRAEGNLVPVFKFGRKAVPGWNIVLPGERKVGAPTKPSTFVPKQTEGKTSNPKGSKVLQTSKLPTVEELIVPKATKSVWVEKASKPAIEIPVETKSSTTTSESVDCFFTPILTETVAVPATEPLSPTKEIALLLDFNSPMDNVEGTTLIEAENSTVNAVLAPASVSTPVQATPDPTYWNKVSGIAAILARQMYVRGIPGSNSTIMEIAAATAGEAIGFFTN
jgi:hypothetical protein